MTQANHSSQHTWPKDDQTKGAVALLTALHEAGEAFSKFGYELYLHHQSVGWKRFFKQGVQVSPVLR